MLHTSEHILVHKKNKLTYYSFRNLNCRFSTYFHSLKPATVL